MLGLVNYGEDDENEPSEITAKEEKRKSKPNQPNSALSLVSYGDNDEAGDGDEPMEEGSDESSEEDLVDTEKLVDNNTIKPKADQPTTYAKEYSILSPSSTNLLSPSINSVPASPSLSNIANRTDDYFYCATEMSLRYRALATTFLPRNSPVLDPSDPLVQKLSTYMIHRANGKKYNEQLRKTHKFRNPDILAQLVDYYKVQDTATHYPQSLFNPSRFIEDRDGYKALYRKAREEAAKQKIEKANRTKVDFVSSSSNTLISSERANFSRPLVTVVRKASTGLSLSNAGVSQQPKLGQSQDRIGSVNNLDKAKVIQSVEDSSAKRISERDASEESTGKKPRID